MHMLIILHVVLLVASVILTSGSTLASILGTFVPKLVNMVNIAFTTIGVGAGVILLLDKPLGVRCAALTAYLVAFTLTQIYVRRHNKQLASIATR